MFFNALFRSICKNLVYKIYKYLHLEGSWYQWHTKDPHMQKDINKTCIRGV